MGKKKFSIEKMIYGGKKLKHIIITDCGKMVFKKNKTVDLSEYGRESIRDTIVSRLEGIPTNEEITINMDEDVKRESYRLDTTVNCSNIIRAIELWTMGGQDINAIPTIVIQTNKKMADMIEDHPVIQYLKRVSVLSLIMKASEDRWRNLNHKDHSQFTNVLWIPSIPIILESKGKTVNVTPPHINLLVLAYPSIDNATPGIELMDQDSYLKRIVTDTVEAAVRLGAKDLLVDPYEFKPMQKDIHKSAVAWYGILESQRAIENINTVSFNIYDDSLYVIFKRNH